MQSLKWIGYGAWALGGIMAVWGLSEGIVLGFVLALSLAISGVLFLAFDQVIELLRDIRDSLQEPVKNETEAAEPANVEQKPVRSLAEISADLDKMKTRVNKA
jgi:hypothetical protein